MRQFLLGEALGAAATYGPSPLLSRRQFEVAWAMHQRVQTARNRTEEQRAAAASARRALRLARSVAPGQDIPDPNAGVPAHLRTGPQGIPLDPGF